MVARSQLAPDPASGQGLSGVHLFQDGTDITFLRERAEINGYELMFAGGLVYFGPMRLSGQPQATIKVYAGLDTNCLSFDLDANGHQPDKAGYDAAPETGTATVSGTVAPNIVLLGPESAAGGGPGLPDFVWRLRRTGTNDEAELNARAQAKANDLAMRVKVGGELDGTLYAHVLQVGKLVPVDGVGSQFNGLYYVDTVSHHFSVDGYRQSFKLMRNAYGDNVPAVPGLPGGLSVSVSLSF
jgi:phage protein D